MPRPTSTLRLLTLLAIAHASLAFYLWFCAFDLALPATSLRLWEILGALWLVWPALLAYGRAAALALARRSGIQFLTNAGSSRARSARFSRYGRTSPCAYTKEIQ